VKFGDINPGRDPRPVVALIALLAVIFGGLVMFLSQQDTGPTEVLGTTATPVPLTATPVPLTARALLTLVKGLTATLRRRTFPPTT